MRSKDENKMQGIIAFIEAQYSEEGYVPTISDIAAYMGMEKGNVSRYLADMSNRGMIDISEGLRFAKTPNMLRAKSAVKSVPLVGEIACGTPILAQENIESYVYISKELLGEGDFFALRAKGSSMINAGINSGDVVIVRRQDTADEGQIIVALIDDEATLKRFYTDRKNRRIRLHPENDELADMYFDSIEIQGVVKKILKDAE